MVDAIGSVLPPQLRPKLTGPPKSPPRQFNVIEQVSGLQLAGQRAATILSRIQGDQEETPKSTEDFPEVEEYRGGSVNVTT